MEVYYSSTRGYAEKIPASKAILKGLAPDGGLYVPDVIPTLDIPLSEIGDMDYRSCAYEVMRRFFTDYTEGELRACIDKAYDEKFDTEEMVELARVNSDFFLELYHGPTIAFKDMALSILPHLLTTAARKTGEKEEIVILTATSGDTGKAAMAGFADVDGVRIIVFFPKGGVSEVQRLQMVTQRGKNVSVVAIHGNFDDAQSGVKAMFESEDFNRTLEGKGFRLSSANSINIGRLVPQIVYYVYAYGRLLREGEISEGEPLNVVVPTGNFGNILAAYYCKKMGIPIGKLICASNENKVLFDFFNTGIYDRRREFKLTNSPSMDILISSNLERLIFEISGRDASVTGGMMRQLKTEGYYSITDPMKERLKDFEAGFATEEETLAMIRSIFSQTGYVVDTHTAVAAHVCRMIGEREGYLQKSVIASTASPYKFADSVLKAIGAAECGSAKKAMELLHEQSKTEIPGAVSDLWERPILHDVECEASDMQKIVSKLLTG